MAQMQEVVGILMAQGFSCEEQNGSCSSWHDMQQHAEKLNKINQHILLVTLVSFASLAFLAKVHTQSKCLSQRLETRWI